MILIPLPGRPIAIECLLLDLNGTLATDGQLLAGVDARIDALRDLLAIEIASGDTFGTARPIADELGLPLTPLPGTHQAEAKLAIVRRLGGQRTAMIGNGNNDALALDAAALGICVLGAEGAAPAALLAADILARDPLSAFDLLLQPNRLVASLRC